MSEETKWNKYKRSGLLMLLLGIVFIVGMSLGLAFSIFPPDANGQAAVYVLLLIGGILNWIFVLFSTI